MLKKTIFAILAITMMTMLLLPVQAWVYPDCHSDLLFERFVSNDAENLLIHYYANDPAEFAALKAGEIDICDWPLPKNEYQIMTAPPYDQKLKVVNYGPEYGLYILDMNCNNNSKLGNPPDPAFDNPQYVTGPGKLHLGNWLADVWLRRALAYLIDRPTLITDPTIGAGFGYPMYTTMPPSQPKYLLDIYGNTTAPWAWKYDPVAAAAMLDAHGYAIGTSGKREYRGDVVKLLIYIRSDHPGRNHIGQVLQAEMAALSFDTSDFHYATSATTYTEVMVNKDFHIYTGGWSLSVDPDMSLWNWAYYWHPGFCYNYGGINDPQLNAAADNMFYANNQAEAVMYCIVAQWRQAYLSLSIPVYCVAGNKGYAKYNVGGHAYDNTEYSDIGYNANWTHVVNLVGYGIDNGWTLMNMRTIVEGGGGTTIDYGFKVPAATLLNPIYASWLFDWNVLGLLYDGLLARNASDLGQWMNWMTNDFSVSLYNHPVYGECSKVRFTLRPGLKWSDGVPLTVADIYFTFVELKNILHSRHFPNPWWWSSVQDILSFSILDPFNFEVLLDVKSYWVLGWIGGNIILPKHIWKPIALTGDPQMDYRAHPEVFVASGSWKMVNYNEPAGLMQLARNTNFHRYDQVWTSDKEHATWLYKFKPADGISPTITVENLDKEHSITLDCTYSIDWPNGTTKQYAALTSQLIGAGGKAVYVLPVLPAAFPFGLYGLHVIWDGHYICVLRAYRTIPEDIGGSNYYNEIGWGNYTYKTELPTPDIKVDIVDVARASAAFGSYPGHAKWSAIADVNGDYKIDIVDLARISKMFGWHG